MRIENRFEVESGTGYHEVMIRGGGYNPHGEFVGAMYTEVVLCGEDQALANRICDELNAVLDKYEPEAS